MVCDTGHGRCRSPRMIRHLGSFGYFWAGCSLPQATSLSPNTGIQGSEDGAGSRLAKKASASLGFPRRSSLLSNRNTKDHNGSQRITTEHNGSQRITTDHNGTQRAEKKTRLGKHIGSALACARSSRCLEWQRKCRALRCTRAEPCETVRKGGGALLRCIRHVSLRRHYRAVAKRRRCIPRCNPTDNSTG